MSMPRLAIRFILVASMIAVVASAPGPALGIDPKGVPPKNLPGFRTWMADDGTWHFVMHTKNPHVFEGTIHVAGAKIRGVLGIDKLEKDDSWVINEASDTITFKLHTAGKVDRIDLTLTRRARALTFNLKEDGMPMSTKRIHVGSNAEHPDSVPFTLPGGRTAQ
jgi:hypothetical protein